MKNWKNLSKRAAAMGLSLMMCAALLPGTAFAAKVDAKAPCGHNTTIHPAMAVSSTKHGQICYSSCAKCGKYWPGVPTEKEPDAPTCTLEETVIHYEGEVETLENGVKVIHCTVCGIELGRNDPATEEHVPLPAVRENEIPATCTESGSYDEVTYCKYCGEEVTREHKVIEPAHTPGEAVQENVVTYKCTWGTCDEVVYCTECGEELSRESAMVTGTKKHSKANGLPNSSVVKAVYPTCTEGGNWKYYECIFCHRKFSYQGGTGEYLNGAEIRAPYGHQYEEPVWAWNDDYTEATATFTCSRKVIVNGYAAGTCGNEETLTAVITSDSTATCVEAGTVTYTATVELEVQGEIKTYTDVCTADAEATGIHTPADAWSFDGDTHYHICEVCGEQLDTAGHTYVATVTLRPTETEEGIRRYDCTVCDHYYLEDIPATGSLPPVDNEVEIDENDTPLASGPVTRAEFVDYLWRHENQPEAAAATFVDVAADHEFAAAIGWAQANGLVLGSGSDKFNPDDVVTVAQVRTILTRYAEWAEMAMPELTTLTGEDNAPVLNCDEVLAEFFGA